MSKSNTESKTVTIDDLLNFDPLLEAEKITGVSYKDTKAGEGFDNPASALGFLLAHDHARAKEEKLMELGDTVLSNDLDRYQAIIEKYGFEKVLEDDFLNDDHRKEDEQTWEKFFVYAHRKYGLLLSFDTFTWVKGEKPHVNGGSVVYNWKPLVDNWQEVVSSGGYIDNDVWGGNHDCREALIHKMNNLNNRGEFVIPWHKRPFLWLLHYGETRNKNYDHKAVTAARIERLPQWVKDFIGPE